MLQVQQQWRFLFYWSLLYRVCPRRLVGYSCVFSQRKLGNMCFNMFKEIIQIAELPAEVYPCNWVCLPLHCFVSPAKCKHDRWTCSMPSSWSIKTCPMPWDCGGLRMGRCWHGQSVVLDLASSQGVAALNKFHLGKEVWIAIYCHHDLSLTSKNTISKDTSEAWIAELYINGKTQSLKLGLRASHKIWIACYWDKKYYCWMLLNIPCAVCHGRIQPISWMAAHRQRFV